MKPTPSHQKKYRGIRKELLLNNAMIDKISQLKKFPKTVQQVQGIVAFACNFKFVEVEPVVVNEPEAVVAAPPKEIPRKSQSFTQSHIYGLQFFCYIL